MESALRVREAVAIYAEQGVEWAVRRVPEEHAMFVREVVAAVREVGSSAGRFVVATFYLVRLVGWPALRRSVAAFRRQPWAWITVEIMAVFAVLAYVQIRRWFRRSKLVKRLGRKLHSIRAAWERRVVRARKLYADVLTGIANKSRLAAAFFPHLVMLAGVYLAFRAFPAAARNFVASPQLCAVVVGARIYATDVAVRLLEEQPSQATSGDDRSIVVSEQARAREVRERGADELKFWVCFAAERLVHGLWFALPYGASTVARLGLERRFDLVRGLYVLWLQVFPVSARALGYAAVARAVRSALPSLGKKRGPSRLDKYRDRVSSFARFLTLPWLFGDRIERFARVFADIVSDADAWLLLLVGLCSFFTIGPVARVGALAVGYVLPVLTTIKLVDQTEPTPTLLAYWMARGIADLTLLLSPSAATLVSWIPFRAHLTILLLLWLQLPYFQGARLIHVRLRAQTHRFLNRFNRSD